MTHIKHGEKVLVMRIFLAVLVLIFIFQSFTKADDIRDFEIEGISIGDSALNYFSKKTKLVHNCRYAYQGCGKLTGTRQVGNVLLT